jgi:K+-transporting ATPase KdpF subunit
MSFDNLLGLILSLLLGIYLIHALIRAERY